MTKLIEITGKAISGEWGNDDTDGTGIPVLRTTNFTNDGVINFNSVVTRSIAKKNLEEKYLQRGDIIIEKSGGSTDQPVGRVVYFDAEENKYLFNNFTGVLRIKDKSTWFPRYVFWALYYNYRIGGTKPYQNKTTGLHNLQTEQYICNTEIHETSYIGQKRIAAILDKVDVLISLRKKQLQKLDDLVKARFVEMFGDPEYNSKAWSIYPLEKLCTVGSSKRIYQNEQSIKGVPFWRISDLVCKMDTGNAESGLFIPEEKYIELKISGLVPNTGDILVTSRGTLGRCYIVKKEDCFYFQDGMISWLSHFSDDITPLYLKYLFEMPGIKKQIDEMQAGSTVAYLSIAMLKKLKIMVPSRATQNAFSKIINQIDESKQTIQHGLDKLEQMKQVLMQKYFG